jgi:hypothetical protein
MKCVVMKVIWVDFKKLYQNNQERCSIMGFDLSH